LSFIYYNLIVYEIETTEEFDAWLHNLRDISARGFIAKRIAIMSSGSLGETRSLGGGLFEAKIRRGPGYRLYFLNKGNRIIVLLCGGDKSTQNMDIKRAKELAKEM
jgi:putative addiction module killer protein